MKYSCCGNGLPMPLLPFPLGQPKHKTWVLYGSPFRLLPILGPDKAPLHLVALNMPVRKPEEKVRRIAGFRCQVEPFHGLIPPGAHLTRGGPPVEQERIPPLRA